MSGRRTPNDPGWADIRTKTLVRDRGCRLRFCLTMAEGKSLTPSIEKNLDPAHVFSAADRPDLIYYVDNVVTLSRDVHRRMDNYLDPITGEPISAELHWWWWYRIMRKSTEKFDDSKDYESMCLALITS